MSDSNPIKFTKRTLNRRADQFDENRDSLMESKSMARQMLDTIEFPSLIRVSPNTKN